MKRITEKLLRFSLIMFIFYAATGLVFPLNIAEAGNVSGEDINTTIDRLLTAEHVEGEIIVKFKDAIAADPAVLAEVSDNAHSQTGATITTEFRELKGLHHVAVPQSTTLREALEYYLLNSQVEYAEPNYIYYADVLPNDPSFSQLWGLHNTGQTAGTIDADIDAPEAWDLTTGSASVVIAVIDSGVDYNHSDLSANIWTNTGETSCTDGVDNDGNGYIDDCLGWDFVNGDNNPMDDNDHGTHVSGTIAADGNNGIGVAGVNWTAKIMPLKFLDSRGSGSTTDAILAILYANANGADVISNSWGGGAFSQALKDAIDASPAVVVCAAGNDSTDNDVTPSYPASYTSTNLLSVAATTDTDAMAYFSNYGLTSVDLGAPGENIYSTIPNDAYDSYSGTSMATPHVSGVAGLVKALNPGFTNLDIISRIMNTVDPTSAMSGKVVTGGRLNAYNALTGIVTAPDISATPASMDFGSVVVGSISTNQIFTISNDGTSDLVIGNVYLTGTNPFQFSILNENCSGQTLASSVTCTIEAQYIPTKTGTMYANIGIGSNDFDTPTLYIDLTGTGVQLLEPDISVTPSIIDFGNVITGNSSAQVLTVGNNGVNDLIIGTVTSPLSPFSISADNCSGQTLVSSATCTITYSFSPASEATFSSSSDIPSNDPDTPIVTVSLTGAGVIVTEPDISATPAGKNFGTVAVSDVSPSQIFTISNNGTLDLVIGNVYLTGTNPFQFSLQKDTCAGVTLLPSGTCTMEAQYAPTKTGTMYAKIGIDSNDPDTSTLYIDLTGTSVTTIPPVAAPGGPYTGIEGQSITLDGSGSTDSDGTITLYEWDIDNDGTFDYSSSLPTQSHTYAQQGTYTINLRVTDDLGATNEATTTATILDTLPTADFTGSPTSGITPLTVNFTDNSAGYDQPLTYEWDFDNDGVIDSIVQNPSNTYNTAGIYTVSLTVTDSDGSSNSLTRTDYITVDACLDPVRISGAIPVYYSTLQAAYDAAVDGDVIQSQDVVFVEDLNINLNKSVTLEGGYDCDYATVTGVTTINGTMTIIDSTITMGNFVLE